MSHEGGSLEDPAHVPDDILMLTVPRSLPDQPYVE